MYEFGTIAALMTRASRGVMYMDATSAGSVTKTGALHTGLRWDRARIVAWLIIALLAAVYAWADRFEMGSDGMSYLDIADAFARGDWHMAFNTYWSPLYPALIAMAWRILHPSPYWEFPTVHLLNFLIYLGALASFEFLLLQLIRYHRNFSVKLSAARTAIPEWALKSLGYTLFAYTSLEVTRVSRVTPDLCVSAIVFLAAGLLLMIALRPEGKLAFPLLGVVLGVGYLAKAPMFPLALVFLLLGAMIMYRHGPPCGVSLRVMAGLAGFAILASVLVVAFLKIHGRMTLGDSAKLNYAWEVNGLPFAHWQGGFPGNGSPAHPTRMIFPSPPVYEFATPVGGTYPPWHDPAYWYEGVRVHFDASAQWHSLVQNARVLYHTLFPLGRAQATLVIGGLLLLCLRHGGGLFLRNVAAYSIILIPAVTAFGMFSLIHLEPRFVPAFIALFWLSLFAAIPWPATERNHQALKGLVAAMIAMLVASAVTYRAGRYSVKINPDSASNLTVQTLREEILRGEHPHLDWDVAHGLQKMGVQRGDKVAVIGASPSAFWARLSRVRIVTEMPACREPWYTCMKGQPDGVSAFVAADQGTRDRILRAFARTGAKVVVIRLKDSVLLRGWQRISDTDYYAYLLDKMGGPVPALAASKVTRRAKPTSLHAVQSFTRGKGAGHAPGYHIRGVGCA